VPVPVPMAIGPLMLVRAVMAGLVLGMNPMALRLLCGLPLPLHSLSRVRGPPWTLRLVPLLKLVLPRLRTVAAVGLHHPPSAGAAHRV
jgi:hypothetical protein